MDLGSSMLRAGYSLQSSPPVLKPPYVARMRDPSTGKRSFLIGHEALISSARSTARPAYEGGIPNNPVLLERLLDSTFSALGLAEETVFPYRFVMTEAPCQPNSARALIMEIMFEAYEAPAICFGIDALFSYFYNRHSIRRGRISYARDDAVLLSCGYNSTHVLPIVQGRLAPSAVQRINVGGATMTNQLTRRMQLLHSEHSNVLTPARLELLKERVCYVSNDYDAELKQIQTNVNFYNDVTKRVKVPMPEKVEKPVISLQEQEKKQLARIDHGRRLSEMMKEKRRGRSTDASGNEDQDDSSYTEEEVKLFYHAMKRLYDLQRIDEVREIDEDRYYLAMQIGNFESSTSLHAEIEKRRLELQVEREKLGDAKCNAAETAWWKRTHEDELLSMSDSELSPSELKRKRHVRALRGAAEARIRAKKAKELEIAEAQRKKDEIQKMREEHPQEYLQQLRTERHQLASKIKKRFVAREAGSDRRSQAARERMRLLAQHAGSKPGFEDTQSGKGRGRGKGKGKGRGRGRGRRVGRGGKRSKTDEDDNFGWNDSDWDVYRSMKVGGNESDSEDNSEEERARLEVVRDEILSMDPNEVDPTLSKPEGVALMYEDMKNPEEFPITIDRLRTPELLFQPMLAGVEQCGIVEALRNSVSDRSSIVKEVFMTGGVARTPRLRERICAELRKEFPSEWGDDIVAGVQIAEDPMLDAWRGAALFAEQGGESFDKACISKAEYEEMGNGYLKEHAFGNLFFPTPILSAADLELKKKLQKQASKRGRGKGPGG